MTHAQDTAATFPGLIDLVAEKLGGVALLANDAFFAPMENLLKPGRGVFIPDKYTDNGKWMDGWETRRRRTPGHDWCIIQMGLPGVISGVDIDTNHFLGNHPPYASLEACCLGSADDIERAVWVEILPKSPLRPGSQNLFTIADTRQWTHVRLNIYPDGGVARLRVYGEVVPDWSDVSENSAVDLASVTRGGKVVACSDMFFSPMQNLIMPYPSANMGDGWETRRRRGPGYDWVVVKLGAPGLLRQVDVGTHFFKGNYPDRCSLEACYHPDTELDALSVHEADWKLLLPETKLQADTLHRFDQTLLDVGPVTHVRLNIYPDGGISRLRVYGVRVPQTSVQTNGSQAMAGRSDHG